MNGLLDVLPEEERARAARCDGWTGAAQAAFLRALADCGVVETAAKEAKLSVASAYAFRRKVAGAMFQLGWEGAVMLARRRLVDVLMARAIDGQDDVLTRDGDTATRHRHDNRLGTAMLTRLDNLAEGAGQDAMTARLIAQDFDTFVDMIENGSGGAQAALFLEANRARLDARMAGFFGANGYPQLKGFRPLEEAIEEEQEEVEVEVDPVSGLEAYKNDDGEWMTNFPPPPGFDGDEDGCFGDDEYERSLSDHEMVVVLEREEAELAELQALAATARDAFFGFVPKRPRRVKAKGVPPQEQPEEERDGPHDGRAEKTFCEPPPLYGPASPDAPPPPAELREEREPEEPEPEGNPIVRTVRPWPQNREHWPMGPGGPPPWAQRIY